ncbi:MAG: gliding motility-associated C-terminal domain-containing protein, partial [Bacteroidetes bacterium]|nr:gliding motility-associated C-terminal domain-containing protein [Bacteroidota bacterium]
WDFGDGNISLLANPSHTYDNPGTFQIRLIVSDTGSCNQNDTVYRTLVVLGNPTADLPGQAICIGQSIQIGTTAIPDPSLSYNWFPAIYLNNSHIPNPIATPSSTTEYYLLITNGSCADTIRQRVKVYDLSVDAGTDTIVCVVSVNLTATANEDSLMFQWSSNPQFTDTLNLSLTDRTVTVNVLNQTQWFYVRSFNNLCSAIDSVSVSFAIPITPGEGQNPTCPDSCNGTAVVEINGGTPPYQYLWNTGQTTDSVSHLCAGIYMVTVTDAVACVSVATIMLSDPPRVVVIPASTNIPCQEVCNGQIDLSVSGGNSPYFYAWSNGQTTATIGNLCQGTYQVTVTDNHGCKKTSLSEIQVNSIFIDVHLTSSMDTVYQGQPSQLEATLIPGCTYSWTPADGLDNPASPNPLATPYVTTIYHVLITDAFGCVYSDSVKIIVKEVICRDPYIYVPNAFTPNHDGKNDVVFIQGNMIESMKFSVYDRWGNKVFETRNQLDGWDGICKKGNCESGVYVFYLEATCYNKEVFKKKGNITLLR